MWQKYLERALRFKLLADYYRSQDTHKYHFYLQRYLRNQKRFVEEYERLRHSEARSDSPSVDLDSHSAYLRFLHAYTTNPTAVDVYLNERLVAQNIPFAAITSYLRLPADRYQLNVYATGKKEVPIIDQQISIEEHPYTLAIVDDISGTTKQASLLSYEDDLKSVVQRAKVRLIHLSPNAPRVDVAVRGGNVLFSNVGYTDARFISVPSGTYHLEIRIAGTNQVIYTIPFLQLDDKKVYSIFAVGRVRGNPAFRVLVVQDR